VAPAVGGIPELVEHGVTGLVVPPGDVGRLADALQELLANESVRVAMGGAARRRAELRFSRAAQIDRLLEVWSSVVH
jgi:starch synthase